MWRKALIYNLAPIVLLSDLSLDKTIRGKRITWPTKVDPEESGR